MAYRITRTVGSSVNPDPMLAMAEIGLLSNLEIWLGIIVACMPTLAPVLRTYVQPSLIRLSQKLYGSSAPSKDEQTPRMPLRTYGGSAAPAFYAHGHQNQPGFTDKHSYSGNDSGELGLVWDSTSFVQTNCASGGTNVPYHHGGIHVQKQFQTHGS